MLPQRMVPYLVFGEACLHAEAECPQCQKPFKVYTGVAYETLFRYTQGEKSEVRYGHIALCSLDCLLRFIPTENYGRC